MKKYQRYLDNHVMPHIGHLIEVKIDIHKPRIWAKLLRVVIRPDLYAAELWLESAPFSMMVYSDQITDCKCRHQTKEWNWGQDYH